MDIHVTPNPSIAPLQILKDFRTVIFPTIGLGMVAGAAIVGIVASTPKVCEGGPAHDGGCPEFVGRHLF